MNGPSERRERPGASRVVRPRLRGPNPPRGAARGPVANPWSSRRLWPGPPCGPPRFPVNSRPSGPASDGSPFRPPKRRRRRPRQSPRRRLRRPRPRPVRRRRPSQSPRRLPGPRRGRPRRDRLLPYTWVLFRSRTTRTGCCASSSRGRPGLCPQGRSQRQDLLPALRRRFASRDEAGTYGRQLERQGLTAESGPFQIAPLP